MGVVVTVAVLPARSVAVPVAVWLAPSALRVMGLWQLATFARLSAQVKVMVTGAPNQPAALGAVGVVA